MSEITTDDLVRWYSLKRQLEQIKEEELDLRVRIFAAYFKDPKEGTNNADLPDGTGAQLKATYVLNRTLDMAVIDEMRERQLNARADSNAPRLNLDLLIKNKPELAISQYRTLTEEERHYFDTALLIKPGTPSLDITIPKKNRS